MTATALPVEHDNRGDIIVTGANGTLGQAVLRAIGPEHAIAVTRKTATPLADYRHACLDTTGRIAPEVFASARAVINAAGCVSGTADELHRANVALSTSLARQAREEGLTKFVQVGSFSVYGYADIINDTTPVSPASAYGRSKALADEQLFGLMTADFAVESMRLPFLFSEVRPALLGPLIALGRRARLLPSGRPPMQRSMLVYDDAAKLLVEAASSQRRGPTLAADSRRFDYALLCRLVAEERGQRWRTVTLPQFATTVLLRLAPGIGRRLFRSSVLSAEANQAGLNPLGLENALRAIICNAIPER